MLMLSLFTAPGMDGLPKFAPSCHCWMHLLALELIQLVNGIKAQECTGSHSAIGLQFQHHQLSGQLILVVW